MATVWRPAEEAPTVPSGSAQRICGEKKSKVQTPTVEIPFAPSSAGNKKFIGNVIPAAIPKHPRPAKKIPETETSKKIRKPSDSDLLC